MRNEYDFTPEELRKGVRGKYAERFKPLNQGLRAMAGVFRVRSGAHAEGQTASYDGGRDPAQERGEHAPCASPRPM